MLLVLKPAVDEFLLEKNLEIPQEKSFLFNIRENEIRFFGFSFRKRKFNYRTKSETAWKNKNTKSSARIDILPSQEKQKLFKLKVKKIISVHSDVSTLIIVLNQYLKGWAHYFNTTSTSAEHVRKCHRPDFRLCWKKVLQFHPNLTRDRLKKRFFPKHKFYQNGLYVTRAWVFSSETKLERRSDPITKVKLYNLDSVEPPKQPMISAGLNAYILIDKLRLERGVSFLASSATERVGRRQKFVCPTCGQSLKNGETFELHHSLSLKI